MLSDKPQTNKSISRQTRAIGALLDVDPIQVVMHRFNFGFVGFMYVIVYFKFCFKDFATFWTHILSRAGMRGDSTLDGLTHSISFLQKSRY